MAKMEAQRFPIDYETLQKGDVVPVERIEEIVNMKRDDVRFSLKVAALVDRIRRELLDRDKPWTVAVVKGQIRVLTDAEATIYQRQRREQAHRSERQAFFYISKVDVAALTPEQRVEHEREVINSGRFIQAMENVRKQMRLEASKRAVPGLPSDSPQSRLP